MTFSDFMTIAARDGRLPREGRPRASFVVRSAEGRPNRSLGISVRAPKPVTPDQIAWLRERGPAGPAQGSRSA